MNSKAHKKQIKSKWQLGWLKKNVNSLQKIIKLIVKSCLKQSKKPSKEITTVHDAKSLKGALRDRKVTAEKLREIFAYVFTAEGV